MAPPVSLEMPSASSTTPIVIATLALDVGGTEQHLAAVSMELVRRGWPVTIFCFNREGVMAARLREAGVEVIGPPLAAKGRATGVVARAALSSLAGIRLARLLRSRMSPIVHFFLTEPYLIGAPLARLVGVPIRIMSRRECNPRSGRLLKVRKVESYLHRRMTAVLGNSRQVVEDLLGEGCPRDKLGLLYSGVTQIRGDASRSRAEMRAELNLTAQEVVAVKVANLIAYKGHEDLIHALALMPPEVRRDLKVLFVGRDDGIGTVLQELARKLGVEQHIRLLGLRRDVPDILGACDLGIHVSHTEGFSNAVIEEMAAGLPMIVSDASGNTDAVTDGMQGYVVPGRAPQAIATALEKLLADPSLRAAFGRAAHERAHRLFSLGSCVDRYEALYRGLAAGKRPAEIPEIVLGQA